MVGRADFFEEGGWNAVCFECGRKRKASQLKKHWQGYYVCPEHWEARQPQDFVRSVPDVQTPPWAQPMPADTFVYRCDFNGMTGWAGYAVAGCAICGYTSPFLDAEVGDDDDTWPLNPPPNPSGLLPPFI